MVLGYLGKAVLSSWHLKEEKPGRRRAWLLQVQRTAVAKALRWGEASVAEALCPGSKAVEVRVREEAGTGHLAQFARQCQLHPVSRDSVWGVPSLTIRRALVDSAFYGHSDVEEGLILSLGAVDTTAQF